MHYISNYITQGFAHSTVNSEMQNKQNVFLYFQAFFHGSCLTNHRWSATSLLYNHHVIRPSQSYLYTIDDSDHDTRGQK